MPFEDRNLQPFPPRQLRDNNAGDEGALELLLPIETRLLGICTQSEGRSGAIFNDEYRGHIHKIPNPQ